MNKQRLMVLGGCSLVILFSSLAFLNQGSSNSGIELDITDTMDVPESIADHTTQQHSLNIREKEFAARPQDMTPPKSPEEDGSNMANQSIWETTYPDYNSAPREYEHLRDPRVDRAFIKVSRDKIESLNEGTRFTLAIPQTGSNYLADVDTTDYHPNGDKTIQAKIKGQHGELYSVTITQGKHATFATIGTPDGVYLLESNTNNGWIASKVDLIKQEDRSQSDAIVFPYDDSDRPNS